MNRLIDEIGPRLGSLRQAVVTRAHHFRARMVSRGLINVITELYLLSFSCKLIFLIGLNLYHNKLLKEHGSIEARRISQIKLQKVQDLIHYLSYNSCEFVSSSIFSFSLYLGINIVYRHISFFGMPIVCEDLVPLVKYLSDPQGETSRIRKKNRNYLSEIILSNVNYTSHVIKIIIKDDLLRSHSNRMEDQVCKRAGSSLVVSESNHTNGAPKSTATALISPPNRTDEVLTRSVGEFSQNCLPNDQLQVGQKLRSGQLKFELDEKLRLLSREYNYLTAIKLDDSCLWPENRNKEWLDFVSKTWFYMYVIVYIGFYILIIATQLSIIDVQYNERVNEANKPHQANWFRGWLVVDIIVCGSLMLHSVASFLSELAIGIMDQNKLMVKFHGDMWQFLDSVQELRQIRAAKMDNSNRDNNKTSLSLSLHEQQLRAQCEINAIRSYIKLRYFLDDTQPLLNFAGSVTTIDLAIIVGICLVTLTYHVDIKPGEFFVFAMLTLLCITKVNLSLLIHAAFSSCWLREAKLSWSLVHCALQEQEEIDPPNKLDWANQARSQKKIESTLKRNDKDLTKTPVPSTESHDDDIRSDELKEKYGRPLMSAHIMFLWRRLISDNQKFSDRLTCRIMGFDSDYNLLISFNFWVVSLIILYFTYKK